MQNENKSVYKWLVKRGSILLFGEEKKVHLEINNERGESCLLTKEDAEEIISILTSLAGTIWDNPDFIKEPYTGPLYKTENEKFYWDLEETKLYIGFTAEEDAIEIKTTGVPALNLSVNYAVEMIQILGHLSKQFR